jgi:ParB family chromosome partitioning protein
MNKHKKSALHQGIGALIPDKLISDLTSDESSNDQTPPTVVKEVVGKPLMVKISDIQHNPDQPRKHFNKEGLTKLATSIKEKGILEPLVVFENEKGYQLVAGFRRLQAAELANLDTVPVIIRERTNAKSESLELALIENILRQDLNPIEEAEAYEKLEKDFSKEVLQIAKLVGKDSSTIKNTVRLLKLPEAVRQDIQELRLTAGHGKALLSLEDQPDLLMQARNKVLAEDMTVRSTENYVKKISKQGKKKTSRDKEEKIAYYESLSQAISDSLNGLKVNIINQNKNKKIIIHYRDQENIEMFLKKLDVTINS